MILRKCLDALTSPRVADHTDDVSPGQRRGRAFCTLLEHLPTDGLPVHGHTPVTLDQHRLVGDLQGAGLLDTDDHLSASEARRLACAHGLLPAVLGGASVPLDWGREKRLFTAHQVLAARTRSPHCQAEGCTTPAAWCQAHHRDPWASGGRTDLADLVLLCGSHHRRAHHPRWRPTYQPSGAVTFHRRC